MANQAEQRNCRKHGKPYQPNKILRKKHGKPSRTNKADKRIKVTGEVMSSRGNHGTTNTKVSRSLGIESQPMQWLTSLIISRYICRQKNIFAKIHLQAAYKRPPTALTLKCQICGAPAPDHLHFGGRHHLCYIPSSIRSIFQIILFLNSLCFLGHCCYSCRAFFRRSTKRKKVKGSLRYKSQDKIFQTIIFSVRCRSGGNNCVVTEGTRKCISCRYDKCIKADMKVNIIDISTIVIMIW